ncbi:MAG: hypothetical protein AB1781_02755 [Pseudomonadota bacterium]
MKRIFAVSVVFFLATALPAAAGWKGTANFYTQAEVYAAEVPVGQYLSFGNPIHFRYWKEDADRPTGEKIAYNGVVQAISLEGTSRMQIQIFFGRASTKTAEGVLYLEWEETPESKETPWWQFWGW